MKISYQLFFGLCLILFLLQLNFLFVDIMEARNFVSAREMMESGDWIFTTLNGEPRYEKPPLPTWITAIFGKIFGIQTVWALRFPAALCCVILIFVFYEFLKKETKDKSLSLIVGFILITSYLVWYVGTRATWDIYCYSFTFIAIYFFYLTFSTNQRNFLYFSLAGIFFGLSILSKGPTGFYVIAAPFFLAYCIIYGFPKIKWAGWIWMGILTVLIGFSWYGYIYLFDKQTLLDILEKESTARTNRNVRSPARYLSFFIQMGIWAVFALFSLAFPYIKKKTKFPKSYLFFFWWTIICLVLLSLIPSKKERYLFPLMIPLAATTGFYIDYLLKTEVWKKWEKVFVKISFGLIGVIGILIPIVVFGVLKTGFLIYPILFSIFSVGIGIYILVEIVKKFNPKTAFLGVVFFMVSAILFGIPVIDRIFNDNPNFKSILSQKERIEESGLNLYGYDAYSPELWFKYGKIIPEIYKHKTETIPKDKEFYLISIANNSIESKIRVFKEMGYNAVYLDKFDDNEQREGTKNHVDRKKMFLFKVRKITK